MVREEKILVNSVLVPVTGTVDSYESCHTFSEQQSLVLKSQLVDQPQELLTLFLAALRVLCTHYQFNPEPLSLKNLFSRSDLSKSHLHPPFPFRIDFPALDPVRTTAQQVLEETKAIFQQQHSFEASPFALEARYEYKMLVINTVSEQIDLDCTIDLGPVVNITFRSPISSPLCGVVSGSSRHYLNILNEFRRTDMPRISELKIMDPSEIATLHEWGGGTFDAKFSHPDRLHQIFEQTATLFPERPAVYSNEHSFTYREINHVSNQLAGYLRSKDVGRGDNCAILVPRTEAMYIAMLAVLKVGAAYIPLDVSIPRERLHFILNDSNCKALISNTRFEEKYSDHPCSKILLDREMTVIRALDPPPSGNLELAPTPADTAYIIYTSGTTGTPKGVKIPHQSICNLVLAEANIFNIKPDDRVFQGFSISFDASLEEIWLAFSTGAQLFVGNEETQQSGNQMAAFINAHQISLFSTVPTLLSTLTEDLPSVTTLILGGEACSMELVSKWATPHRRMVNTYGPTESTVIATFSDCSPNQKVTIGRPVVNYCTYILNAHQQMVPPGVAGELCIGGLSLAEGYVNNLPLTAAKFVTPKFNLNPHFPNRLYRSGDLVRYNAAGEIEFLGRIDSQIKLRGFRIELAEIEAQLLKQEAISNCALTVKKDHNGLEHLIAYVVTNSAVAFDPIAIKKVLRTKLAPYMIPSRFEVIPEIPLLASGKIDRKRLPEPKFQLEPAQQRHVLESTEAHITQLWETIFGMGSISPADNFFDLGGHSLLASQMISELRKDPRYEKLSVKDVYSYPTIEQLTSHADRKAKEKEQSKKSPAQSAAPTQRTSRAEYFTVATLQFFTTILLYGITSLILLLPVFLKNMIAGATWTEIIGGSIIGVLGFYFMWMVLSIVVKWLVIGKFKEGSYPLWSFYYFRFWLVKKFVDMAPINLMAGTPFINLYFKLMGARIGKNAFLGTDRLRVFDLISVGDDCSLLKESTLLGYTIENEMLHLGRVAVGNCCMVGARSLLSLNSKMEDDSLLLELSLLGRDETIPKGEVWKGSPARLHLQQHSYKSEAQKRITGARKIGFRMVQIVAFFVVLFYPQLLAAPFAYVYYKFYEQYDLVTLLVASIPLVALYILAFCLSLSLLKWVLLGKQKPKDIRLDSLLYIRKWIVDTLIFMSLFYFRSVYATLYLPKWLRITGVKIGKRAEISTLNHLSTDLLEIGQESFLADSTSIGVPMVYLGTMRLMATQIGNRSFIGNSAVLLPGSKIGHDCLIGVLSTSPVSENGKINNSSWLGSPPIYLPNRQESPRFPEKQTFHPPWYLYIARGSIEFFKITLPYALASWIIIFFYRIILPFNQHMSTIWLTVTGMLVFTLLSYGSMLPGILFKWLLIGRYKQDAKPLWSTFVWRNELINSITECFIFPLYQNMMLGTPMAPLFFRLMGCKIGRKVYMETTEITEFDLVHLQNGAALNYGSTIQTHLFEDRVMKMSKVEIGRGCTVGAMSVVLYDSVMGNHAVLDGLSLLMKGEHLPKRTKWQGSPSGRMN